MQLRLSLHEVISKSARALRALNFPAGSDTENGENIGWLEARGLPGLQILFEEIINASNTPSHSSVEIKIMKDTVQFSGGNQSAFHFAQSAVDFAENGMNVHIKDCRFPLLIFAEMARRTHLPIGFQIKWMEEDKLNNGFSISGNSEIEINSKTGMTAYDLNITSHKNIIIKNPQKMLYRKKTSVASGISFHPYQWEAVCAAAKKVLVPDSDQSHSSAGPEVDGDSSD